jgi:hypothetical protein
VVAVVLMVTLGGDDDGGPSAGGRSTSAPSSAPTRSPTSTASSAGFSSAPSGRADPDDFVAQLPADFTDCAGAGPAGDGDLAAASCGAATTQPGPARAEFHRYPDVDTLDSAFHAEVAQQGVPAWTDDADCSTTTGFGEWVSGGVTGGQVACAIGTDGSVMIVWTDDEYLAEGIVSAPGTTQADVRSLYDWWTANSFFEG